MYTEEQLEHIEKLRTQRDKEREDKVLDRERKQLWEDRKLKAGTPVFVTIEGKTISGYVVGANKDYGYTVSTPHGTIEDVKSSEVRRRVVQDLSNVEVPEELKSMSTKQLLSMLQGTRSGSWHTNHTPEQIKAELKNRPHVETKGERKVYKKRVS
jgi:hypothetical protein